MCAGSYVDISAIAPGYVAECNTYGKDAKREAEGEGVYVSRKVKGEAEVRTGRRREGMIMGYFPEQISTIYFFFI